MSGTFSDAQVHEWLQDIVDDGWISLHYDDPNLDGFGGSEIAGGGYRRIKGVFSAPSNRTIWLLQDAVWAGLPQTIVSHFGIWSDQFNGRISASGKIVSANESGLAVVAGQGHVLRQGQLALSIG